VSVDILWEEEEEGSKECEKLQAKDHALMPWTPEREIKWVFVLA